MKKKIARIVNMVLATVLCLTMFSGPVYAAAVENSNMDVVEPEEFTGFSENPEPGVEAGNYLSFQPENESIPSQSRLASARYSNGQLIYSKDIALDQSTVRKERAYYKYKISRQRIFVKYLTGSWAKANSYSWSTSNTVTWQASTGADITVAKAVVAKLGLSYSRTTTYGTTITLPADSSKYSKLGFASDYTDTTYEHKRYNNSTLLFSKTVTIKNPEKNTYLRVYYKA